MGGGMMRDAYGQGGLARRKRECVRSYLFRRED